MNVTLTKNAQEKIHELIALESRYTPKFRVFVTGGGCSGFEYGFSFEKEAQEDDWVLNHHELITVLVDAVSAPYLDGVTVDYEKTLKGEKFVVNNPNASSTCSCGSSFSVD